ncbi:hypothetical protein Lal_00033252 [Lupinus albus]|nr:hypothetical protein Lal_00033252 [Lupinus albus]
MYKSCLHDPQFYVQGELTKVGPLTIESRLLHYLIAYILVQRNTNHVQPNIIDLKLMFTFKEGIMVNWLAEILKVMAEIASSSSRLLAYEIFISRVIDHLEIDMSDLEVIFTNSCDHLVGDNLIHKMSYNVHNYMSPYYPNQITFIPKYYQINYNVK